jgi:glucosyl-3-phosphoglycerate synthase
MDTEQWLRERTFHHSRFWDIKYLVTRKQEQNLRISLCLPTLNEESTIGKVLVILKSELIDRYPLLDEIAVIDSGSKDRTLEIAKNYGADTYLASECLPQYGDHRGKGENLWKALYLLTGDIIIYIDSDITNIHPRFVYGLLGPLLNDPEVQYSKAFYDRPLSFSGGLRSTGGGRVTEILTRPTFSLFYPELAPIIQPLSGEYAGRRTTLERIPYPVGYGVETAMLIDIFKHSGLTAFAQVDLDQRVHRNQETTALGRMSFGILRTLFRRLERDGKLNLETVLPQVMQQCKVADMRYEMLENSIEEFERPPMLEIQEYRDKFDRGPAE